MTLLSVGEKKKPVGEPFRFFAVGEYGDEGGRPHYHLVAFGPKIALSLEDRISDCWSTDGRGRETRSIGRISAGLLTPERASYCASYTIKKITHSDSYALLPGQEPEFSMMSRRPPLGHHVIDYMVQTMYTENGSKMLAFHGVPTEFRLQGRRYPIGRYWVNYMREELGVETKKTPVCDTEEYRERFAETVKKAAKLERKFFRGTKTPRQDAESRGIFYNEPAVVWPETPKA